MAKEPITATHPNLVASLWDYARNAEYGVDPDKVSRGSSKKAWWRCEKGHSWLAATSSVVSGSKCTYCAGKAVLIGFNDLLTLEPEIVENLWDYGRNSLVDVHPTDVTRSSGAKVGWMCSDCGYTWVSRVVDVVRGYRCSVCGNTKIVPGINDIFSKRPDLRCKWRYDLNTVDPATLGTGNGSVMAWWDCSAGHPYKATSSDVSKGVGCGVCRGFQVHPGYNDLATKYPEAASRWNIELNGGSLPSDVSYGAGKYAWFTCDKGHDTYTYIPDSYRFGCGKCVSRVSEPENQVADYISTVLPGVPIIRNTRAIISPKEIDIYIPDKNLAIEFNGVFTHSDYYTPREGVDGTKAKMVRELGIDFMAVWEDDWRDRRHIVEGQISHKLGLQTDKVFARKCRVTDITIDEARDILENNHIQGFVGGSWYLGLVQDDGVLVGAAVFTSKSSGEVELNRYATTKSVVGGMSKVISYVERTRMYDHLVTFADYQVSSGELYAKTGWEEDKEISPDYKYVLGGKYRENKRKFRVSRFRTDPTLRFEEGKTEKELAEMNGLHRVYDYGKMRFVKPHPGKDK